MKIGSKYKFKNVELIHWEACAKQLKLKPAYVLARLKILSTEIKYNAASVAQELYDEGLDHSVIKQLAKAIGKRSEETINHYFSLLTKCHAHYE